MTDEDLTVIRSAIREEIKLTVNGKIDAMRNDLNGHNKNHENDMQRILPVVQAFETAQASGKIAVTLGGIITALGGAWLILKQIFPGI